ncbi:MAG TPA: hypothetical protein VK810_06740 [Dongiaceae bacterium]|nr:hypothetical protein [Dongiaceae bacterium]
MKKIWKGWCYLCGGLGIIVTILILIMTLMQSKKDKAFVKTELVPLANYVVEFRDSKGRLPTEEELKRLAKTNYENEAVWYYTNKPDFMKAWGTPGKDFVVGVWRGEWIQYYSSWDKKDFSE